jgi:hypothetical protein
MQLDFLGHRLSAEGMSLLRRGALLMHPLLPTLGRLFQPVQKKILIFEGICLCEWENIKISWTSRDLERIR